MDTIHPLVRALSLIWLVPKRALLRRRSSRDTVERICGRDIRVLPDVFNPSVFRSGRFFAEFLDRDYLPKAGRKRMSVLDLGTGSGVLAVICAGHGHRVTATDVNPQAVRCAQLNAAANDYADSIESKHGDLFAPIHDRRFDLILWNPPFFAGKPRNRFDMSWRSDDVIDRFAAALPAHLAPGGTALIIWSSQSDTGVLAARLAAAGLALKPLRAGHFGVERFTIYALTPAEA